MLLPRKVTGSLTLPGVSVQVADYGWNRGLEIVEEEDCHLLRRRTFPTELQIHADTNGRKSVFGTLMYFPASIPVRTEAATNDEVSTTINCRITREWMRGVAELPAISFEDLAQCLNLNCGRIDQAVRWMGQEALQPGFGDNMLISSLATFVSVELARYLSDMHKAPRTRTRGGMLTPSHLKNITDFIDANIHRCPTLSEIAEICDVSSAHLRRAFKNTTGSTIHHYVETVRLNRAKEMLSGTDLPLKVISYKLGFTASSAFSSAFRKLQGETPSNYRYRTRG